MDSSKKFLVFLLVVAVISGLVAVAVWYSTKDKVVEEVVDYVNITAYFAAFDEVTWEQVETSFVIVNAGEVVYRGRTMINAYEQARFKKQIGRNMYFFPFNNSEYYTKQTALAMGGASGSLDIDLSPIGTASLEVVNVTDSGVLLNLSLKGRKGVQFRQPGVCLKHTFSFLDVRPGSHNYYGVVPPKRIEEGFECFELRHTLDDVGPSLLFWLEYEVLDGGLDEYDSIEIVILDSDKDFHNTYRFEDENGNDVGAVDIFFTLNNLFEMGQANLINA